MRRHSEIFHSGGISNDSCIGCIVYFWRIFLKHLFNSKLINVSKDLQHLDFEHDFSFHLKGILIFIIYKKKSSRYSVIQNIK